jgi:hypothetical protein
MSMSRRSFLAAAGSGAAFAGLSVKASHAAHAAAAANGNSANAATASNPAAGAPLVTAPAAAPPIADGSAGGAAAKAPFDALFPTQAPDLVRELVTVAHFSLAKVQDLVTRRPSLARATWDWGFGDWESALGAASHMGNHEIAEFLLAQGARPDLFSAAMLGQLDVVRAIVAARPGVQATRGPHGITLLAHARAGGERALPVTRFLESLGGADPRLAIQPLPPEDLPALTGRYVFGPEPRDVFIVETYKESLSLRRDTAMGRPLAHLGSRTFSPAGSDAVRIRFSAESPAASLAIHDPGLVVTARRS